MDYVPPSELISGLLESGARKAALPIKDLLIRGFLSGALLGFATSLAITATVQTNAPIVGALVFPVGFVMIVLLGLELVTGSFAVVTVAAADGRCTWGQAAANLSWVFLANLAGSVFYGVLLAIALTDLGLEPAGPVGAKIVAAAAAKTTAYAAHGAAGWVTAFVKAVLCNWMVCLGVVMAAASQSTIGKIVGSWLPILVFFAQGFEHSVVNMFLIPTGMMLGAKVSFGDWWLWNQIPVTLGNFAGGMLFTGLFLYWTYRPAREDRHPARPAVAAGPAVPPYPQPGEPVRP